MSRLLHYPYCILWYCIRYFRIVVDPWNFQTPNWRDSRDNHFYYWKAIWKRIANERRVHTFQRQRGIRLLDI